MATKLLSKATLQFPHYTISSKPQFRKKNIRSYNGRNKIHNKNWEEKKGRGELNKQTI